LKPETLNCKSDSFQKDKYGKFVNDLNIDNTDIQQKYTFQEETEPVNPLEHVKQKGDH